MGTWTQTRIRLINVPLADRLSVSAMTCYLLVAWTRGTLKFLVTILIFEFSSASPLCSLDLRGFADACDGGPAFNAHGASRCREWNRREMRVVEHRVPDRAPDRAQHVF